MWPWGHFGFAFLLYWLYVRGRYRRPVQPAPAVAVVVGSLLADVIDKPLHWIGVFPGGRYVGHSIVFALAVISLVAVVALLLDRAAIATAFAIAHCSHLVADLPPRALLGYPFGTEFLFWPFLSAREFTYNEQVFDPPSIVELVVAPFTNPLPYSLLQIFLFVTAVALWYADGCPGIEYLTGSEQ